MANISKVKWCKENERKKRRKRWIMMVKEKRVKIEYEIKIKIKNQFIDWSRSMVNGLSIKQINGRPPHNKSLVTPSNINGQFNFQTFNQLFWLEILENLHFCCFIRWFSDRIFKSYHSTWSATNSRNFNLTDHYSLMSSFQFLNRRRLNFWHWTSVFRIKYLFLFLQRYRVKWIGVREDVS